MYSICFLHKDKFLFLLTVIFLFFIFLSYVPSKRLEILSTPRKEKCKNIALIKVPKAGSTTLACVLLRFGVQNNLSIYIAKRSAISRKQQQKLIDERQQFNIFAFHAVYERVFYNRIVENPTIIAIIRSPEQRVVSHAFYFHLERKFHDLKGLSPRRFINKVVSNTKKYGVSNVIANYLGLANKTTLNTLAQLNSEIRLVLILERIVESMVLLKRLLHWSHYDIMYMDKKRRKNTVSINSSQIDHLKQTNKDEYDIYAFFKRQLEDKINAEGLDFIREVNQFQLSLSKTRMFCTLNRNRNSSIQILPTKWDDGFIISNKDCQLLSMQWNGFKNRRFEGL